MVINGNIFKLNTFVNFYQKNSALFLVILTKYHMYYRKMFATALQIKVLKYCRELILSININFENNDMLFHMASSF